MRILCCIHHRYAGLGTFEAPLAAQGHDVVAWVPSESPPPSLDRVDALIVLGGRPRVGDEAAHPWLRAEQELVRTAIRDGAPLLGVCLGAQLLAMVAGGTVRRAAEPEIGWHEIQLTAAARTDPVLGALPKRFRAFEWHHDQCLLPPHATALARSARCLQGFRLQDRPAWGIQFHPEATHADLCIWLDSWDSDPDAVATGLDSEVIRRETAERIDSSNSLGRAIIERFLTYADRAGG